MNNSEPLVSIICTAYNQEKYISQALDSFIMQKTEFPFKIIVHDDASTDNTANIIREYEKNFPELFECIYQSENQYSKGNGDVARIVFNAARSKYIALCEGDDYWINPYKLQKQVDFLERNPDHGMVHTRFAWFYNDKWENFLSVNNVPDGYIYEEFLVNSFIGSLTTVTRKELIDKYLDSINKLFRTYSLGDRPLWLYIASSYKIGFLNEVTAVYRRHGQSVTSFNSIIDELNLFKQSYQIRFFFMDNVKKPSEKTIRKVYEDYNRGLLEYNSLIYNKKGSIESFQYLRQNNYVTLKDRIFLLRSKGALYDKISSFLMLLVYNKKSTIKSLLKRLIIHYRDL